jgi:hypothetical protein
MTSLRKVYVYDAIAWSAGFGLLPVKRTDVKGLKETSARFITTFDLCLEYI